MNPVGIALREEAIARVDANAAISWKDAAMESVKVVASALDDFTTDTVWDYLDEHYPGVTTHEGRAMGAIMRLASKQGIVTPTKEYRISSRASCHCRPLLVWSSNRRKR